MRREASERLKAWLGHPGRRPLVLRGVRQAGKTWLVRELASASGRDLIELNFERNPQLARHFDSNDPRRILDELSLYLGRELRPEGSLLFLDEIQAAGELLAKLRWFYEELPSLAVVGAGSLLEFTLAEHSFSMPVGRISFGHVEPMSFPEFLWAHGQELLAERLAAWRPGREFSPAAHEAAAGWFARYSMVGGLPAILAADVEGRGPREIRQLQRDLVATYRADFAKYSGRMDRDVLDLVLSSVAASLGCKFVYARAGEGVKQHQAKRALERLAAARLCPLVRWTSASGLPLAAGVKDKFRKAILADVGLLHALVGTPAEDAFPTWNELEDGLRGRLVEQLAGQQLRLIGEADGDGPELFYWQREGGRPGEIDYLVQLHGRIVPVELKAGSSGAMKSLHQFMFDKQLRLAVRCDTNPPGAMEVALKTTRGDAVAYRLVHLPHYLLWNLAHILEEQPSR